MATECNCEGAGFCSRYKIDQSDYAVEVCKGLHGPEKQEAYQRKWAIRLELNRRGGNIPPIVPERETPSIASRSRPVKPSRASPSLPKTTSGPGTELKALLTSLGFKAPCGSCSDKAAVMDAWGVKGCRENLHILVDWLKREQVKLGWLQTIKAGTKALTNGLVFALNPIDPVPGLIEEAIRRAEAKSPPSSSTFRDEA